MYKKLTPDVWFGDKPSVQETNGKVKAIINVAHRIKRPYWKDLGKLPWDVWYFRLAKPDAHEADDRYLYALAAVADQLVCTGKLPILVHCLMGGHRGPTAALFMAWHIGGRQGFEALYDAAKALVPHLRKCRGVYHKSIVKFCRGYENQYEFRKQATA